MRTYVRSKRMNQKKAVLDALAAELRRIIGTAPAGAADDEVRMAA